MAVLLTTGTPFGIVDPLTYELTWDVHLGDAAPKLSIIPISGMPSNHVLVSNMVCGVTLNAGDTIPASGNWAEDGQQSSGGTCAGVTSGELFYAANCAWRQQHVHALSGCTPYTHLTHTAHRPHAHADPTSYTSNNGYTLSNS